jgi:hypothetical protein
VGGLLLVLFVTSVCLASAAQPPSGAKVIYTRVLIRGAARAIQRFRGFPQVMFKSEFQVAHEKDNTAEPPFIPGLRCLPLRKSIMFLC